ncbi:MAG TPA: condensation domain-containing protein, partial [Acidimicrobiales bacterium]
ADPPIGRPLPNVTVAVVDPSGDPLTPGLAGEVVIGGAGVARGYVNRPELTAERFVADPGDPTRRVYRSGDAARVNANGELEFVGRLDDEVKVRGFRVAPAEVEAALTAHPGVADAAVVAHPDPNGDARLVAYVVAAAGGDEPSTSDLRRFLTERLPGYMVPSQLIACLAFPVGPNGKVDRAALPVPDVEPGAPSSHRIEARTATEKSMAEIWARVLGLEEVGTDDDFFDLGGHSLLATQDIAQVREEFGTETPLRAIFEAPTVAGLAALVDADTARGGTTQPLTRQPRTPGARFPLSLAQEQMWAIEARADPPGLYNVSLIRHLRRPVDEPALRRALSDVAERHETLRASFPLDDGRPWQLITPSAGVELPVTDLAGISPADRDNEVRRRVAEHDAQPFDTTRSPLWRAQLLHVDDLTSDLVVTFDHLICDGTSAYIFSGELATAYEAAVAGRKPPFKPLEVQFADFAVWQRRWFTDDVSRRQLEWWAKTLEGAPLGPALEFDRYPTTPSRRIRSRAVTVPALTRQRLEEVARANHTTVFAVAAAGVQAVLSRLGGLPDIVLSTTLSGRRWAQLEGL